MILSESYSLLGQNVIIVFMKNVLEQSMITIVRFLAKRFSNYQLMRVLIVPICDGTVAHGGCTFCTVSGSGDAIVAPEAPIREQFYHEIDFMHLQVARSSEISGLFSKLYQYTTRRLKLSGESYEQAINEPGVVGINIGTRPDCLPDDVLIIWQNSQNVCM